MRRKEAFLRKDEAKIVVVVVVLLFVVVVEELLGFDIFKTGNTPDPGYFGIL